MIKNIHYTDEGYEIVVRTAYETDAEKLLALKLSYIKGSDTIPLYDYEYKNTAEQEAELIKRYLSEDNSILLVAEHNNELIGNIDLTGNQRQKLRHTGMIGMGIAYAWQNRKIGSMLLHDTIQWAKKDSCLSISWLDVYATNIPGRKLYLKYGFEECGIMKNFVHEAQPVDKITMVNYIK